jgi:hypothetical protein
VTQAAISLDNQFLAYYSYGSQSKEAYSNVVSTNLLSSLFDLTPANPFVKQPNELAVWQHVLSNTGSVNDTYRLSLTQATNDNGDLLNPIIVEDTNGNGIYDPAIDTVISQVSLNINKQTTLFVVGTVPANAKPNDVFNTILKATSNNTNEVNTKIDSVTAAAQFNGFNINTADDLIRQTNQSVVWPHVLTNNSSLANDFNFTLSDVSTNGQILDGLTLVQDIDGDGIYNPAIDKIITGSIRLEAGANVALLVIGTVPTTAQQNDVFNVQLKITDTIGGNTKVVNDKVLVVSSPVTLLKQVNTTDIRLVNGQASLNYTLTATNVDFIEVKPVAIVVDGTNFNKVVMEDKLPTGLQLKDLSYTGGTAGIQVLYRLKGDASNQYHLYQKGKIADLSQVETVALALDRLAAQQTEKLSVDVSVIKTDVGSVFNNSFNLRYSYANVTTQQTSNIVSSTILNYQAQLSAAPDLTLDPKTTAVWPHTLTNTGNLSDSYTLALNNIPSNLQDAMLIHDVNNNGVYDEGDKIINASYSITLTPNQQAAILVTGLIAEAVQEGDVLAVDLSATGQNSQQTISTTDRVKVVKSVLKLTKIADKPSIDFENAKTRIDTLTYTLTAENIGSQALKAINVVIDGTQTQKVIFKDALPANVLLLNEQDAANNGLSAVEYSGAGQILYHIVGAAEHRYVSAANKAN